MDHKKNARYYSTKLYKLYKSKEEFIKSVQNL
jgi:hypothetical protein